MFIVEVFRTAGRENKKAKLVREMPPRDKDVSMLLPVLRFGPLASGARQMAHVGQRWAPQGGLTMPASGTCGPWCWKPALSCPVGL